jgi:hypothetical protein
MLHFPALKTHRKWRLKTPSRSRCERRLFQDWNSPANVDSCKRESVTTGATRGVQHKAAKRRQYSSEFKREAVRLVTEGGLSIAQVARDLGRNDNIFSRWKQEATQNGQRAFPGQGILKTKNCLGYDARMKCFVRSE